MDLEPCTASQFDVEVLRYAGRDGWSMRRVARHRTEGYVDGELVLVLAVVGGKVCHYHVAQEPEPIRDPLVGFTYK
jgi:hypothetical protein